MQCLLCQLAFVRNMQVEELLAGVGHAADFGDAQFEAGLLSGEVTSADMHD